MRIPLDAVPPGIQLISAEKNVVAETNSVYRCKGKRNNHDMAFYMKVGKPGHPTMENEAQVLQELVGHALPVPRILWYERGRREYMALEEMQGTILSDLINPSHPLYDPDHIERLLFAYGEALATIHSLPIEWRPFRRTELYGFVGDEEQVEDPRYREIVLWLEGNPVGRGPDVFVHGDLNTANVLFHHAQLSGIIDWEFSGAGWREYDLAWILRQRKNYLNTRRERDSLLDGYESGASFDPDALRWCEVQNYLHIANWAGNRFPAYRTFALEKARQMMFAGYN